MYSVTSFFVKIFESFWFFFFKGVFCFCFVSLLSPGESSSFSLGLHFILVFVRVFFLARRCVRWFIAYFSSLFLDALCLSVTVLIFMRLTCSSGV